MRFVKASKKKARLRLAIAGLPGSGKTFTALNIATHLVPNGRVALIDTERGSSQLYANHFSFDVLDLVKHSPADYIQALELAAQAGYDTIIIDSWSHAWIDALEKVDQTVERGGANSFTAWKKVSPAQAKLVDAILASPAHVICTVRSKVEYALEENDKGKKEVKKLGLAPIQRSGVDYEVSIWGDLDRDHRLLITKSRADSIPPGEMIDRPGEAFAKRLRMWLEDGEEVVFTQAAAPLAAVPTPSPSLLSAIRDAPTVSELEALIPRIKESTGDLTELRGAYNARKAELQGKGAA